VPYTQVAYPTVEMKRKLRLQYSVSHRREVEQDEDLPELLLLAHSPHVLSVLFGVSLDGIVAQLRGDHASNMTLRGFHVLVAHLVLILEVRTDNEKYQLDDGDFDTRRG